MGHPAQNACAAVPLRAADPAPAGQPGRAPRAARSSSIWRCSARRCRDNRRSRIRMLSSRAPLSICAWSWRRIPDRLRSLTLNRQRSAAPARLTSSLIRVPLIVNSPLRTHDRSRSRKVQSRAGLTAELGQADVRRRITASRSSISAFSFARSRSCARIAPAAEIPTSRGTLDQPWRQAALRDLIDGGRCFRRAVGRLAYAARAAPGRTGP